MVHEGDSVRLKRNPDVRGFVNGISGEMAFVALEDGPFEYYALDDLELDTPPCPCCGGALEVYADATVNEEFHPGYHVRGTDLPRRERACVALACTACEFCVEVR